jgi:heme A synthase
MKTIGMSANLARYAWAVLGYNIFVILLGAFVRASGSGAGCGSHWPLCNGEVLPRAPEVATLIEFSHRITSGLALLLVGGLLLWARRLYAPGQPVRVAAVWSTVFILVEALVGAALVLLQLVGDNPALLRGVFIAVHLANTLLLLGALTLCAWHAAGGAPVQLPKGAEAAAIWLGTVLLVVVCSSGAITALGDTLFPAASLAEGLQQDLDPSSHFFVRLRVWHPVLAIGTGVYLIVLARMWDMNGEPAAVRRTARAMIAVVGLQWVGGTLAVVLLAPLWIQITHLLVADVLWVLWVLLVATVHPVRAAAASRLQPVPA